MTAHRPVSITPAGVKFRSSCSCGWVSSPRVSETAALDAVEVEHGWTDGWDVGRPYSARVAELVAAVAS